MPPTDHVTLVSELFATLAANEARWPMDSDANAGVTLTMTPLVIVTVAAAISGPLIGGGLTVA